MSKVLLVEDDNNLREIFEMRLQAEGYETLSASDGEEALVVATREKPELIIADVMMPKLSGFEMLETLRAAPEMSNTKVIMMTALGQAEDQARGEKLGVVKYLVKSQVTLEDFVRVVREVLPPGAQAKASTDAADGKSTNKQESEQNMDDNTNPTTPPAGGDDTSGAPADDQQSSDEEQKTVDSQVNDFASSTPADSSGAGAGDSTFPTTPPTPPADDGEPKPEEGPTATPPASA